MNVNASKSRISAMPKLAMASDNSVEERSLYLA